ncbi:hypothetical protein CBM2606_A120127 [Cupriavidus taiwanensis]|nr:hypothetical protein CBM2606_A120127 [Cupriavidus taiwanensis]
MPSAPSGNSGLVAEVDAPLGQVVGRHFQGYAVAGQDADAVLLHLARSVCPDFNAVFQRDSIAVVRQGFRHHAAKFNEFFLSQSVFLFGSPRRLHGYVSKILFDTPATAPNRSTLRRYGQSRLRRSGQGAHAAGWRLRDRFSRRHQRCRPAGADCVGENLVADSRRGRMLRGAGGQVYPVVRQFGVVADGPRRRLLFARRSALVRTPGYRDARTPRGLLRHCITYADAALPASRLDLPGSCRNKMTIKSQIVLRSAWYLFHMS